MKAAAILVVTSMLAWPVAAELGLEAVPGGEEQTGDDVRTAVIDLGTGSRTVRYTAIDGLAIFEGDIVLGTVAELERPAARERFGGPASQGVAVAGSQYRWPDGTIPYTIDPGLPDLDRVTDAIAHWEASTSFRFVARTTERDFVHFRAGTKCSSMVGRRGGLQMVTLGIDCRTGHVVHEIGHVVGLWHEQSRHDRDRFVRIDFSKVRPDSVHNFDQRVADGDDVGEYDYDSVMHYPRRAFSIDGSDTVIPLDPGARIGQRDRLSAGDVAAANALFVRKADEAGSTSGGSTAGKRRSVGRG